MRSLSRSFVVSMLVAVPSLGALLSGCESLQSSDNFLGVVTPYKVEIVQGNVVTKEQAEAVKPGMNRAQIRDILGAPLVTDPFHQNRWDYVFTIRRQGAEPQRRSVVVMFDGDTMKSIDTGGELPAERDFVASIDTFKTKRNAPPLALTEEQLKALPPPKKADVAEEAAAASAPARSYPPLEAR
jgi:outer membrane protein assembly factor BamE